MSSQEQKQQHVLPLQEEDRLPLPADPKPNDQQITARCHCGRVSLELPTPPDKINECHCSLCYRYGALWGYYPRYEVNILVNILPPPPGQRPSTNASHDVGDSATDLPGLLSYVRSDGDGDIAFFFCKHCGCLTHWELTVKGLEFLRKKAHGHTGDEPEVGINCRMMPPSLLEGVERKIDKFPDFY